MVLIGSARLFARRAMIGGGASSALGLSSSFQTPAARCDTSKIPGLEVLPKGLQDLAPIGGGVSIGSLAGFCSGFFAKKAGMACAVVFGGLFSLQQGLAYAGYVTLNWPKIEKDFVKVLDLNHDGKVDEKDFQTGYLLALKVLQTNTPACMGGFGAGFLLGVKKG